MRCAVSPRLGAVTARLLPALLSLVLSARLGAQPVDLNGTGMSDIWEWTHGALAFDPDADPDGDGAVNLPRARVIPAR